MAGELPSSFREARPMPPSMRSGQSPGGRAGMSPPFGQSPPAMFGSGQSPPFAISSEYHVPGEFQSSFGQRYPPPPSREFNSAPNPRVSPSPAPAFSPPVSPPSASTSTPYAPVQHQQHHQPQPQYQQQQYQQQQYQNQDSERVPRIVICFDYGTTFSGVAWALKTRETSSINDVKVVRDWRGHIAAKVPSVFTYSKNDGELWDLKLDDEAYVIRHSKLKLEKPDRLTALIDLKRTILESQRMRFDDNSVLNGEIPLHLSKTPGDVITSYLSVIAEAAAKVIAGKDARSLKEFPIDLIITHPAEWDHRARNQTFRAVNEAFRYAFDNNAPGGIIRLATEPEACAQFTMKHGQDEHLVNLKPGQCFMVVDAGGGTVDLVTYRVTQVEPTFQFERIKKVPPSSGRFGATRIDDAFVEVFLLKALGPDNYRIIGPRTQGAHRVLGRHMQKLLRQFQSFKHDYAGPPGPGETERIDLLDLVEGIPEDPRRGILDNQLRINSNDMKEMFQESVNGTIQLISQQLILVDNQGLRVKTIFLSGGFSESPYLRKRVGQVARGWRIDTVWGRESQTAVAQGGVLLGLGLGCERPPASVACPFHIGVILAERWTQYDHDRSQKYEDTFDFKSRAKNNIKWLVAKGDLITADEGIRITQKVIQKVARNGPRSGRVEFVFSLLDCRGEPPAQTEGSDDLTRWRKHLDYNLPADMPLIRNQELKTAYHQATMHLDITVSQRDARFELVAGRVDERASGPFITGTPIDFCMVDFENPRA